jgi:hypothetical protein
MTFEELMQQNGYTHRRDRCWRSNADGITIFERQDHYEVTIDVDWTSHSLYPRTLEALQAILESGEHP